MTLCPDPVLGDRTGWLWCSGCSAIREPIHIHGDKLEEMSREALIAEVRKLRGLMEVKR